MFKIRLVDVANGKHELVYSDKNGINEPSCSLKILKLSVKGFDW